MLEVCVGSALLRIAHAHISCPALGAHINSDTVRHWLAGIIRAGITLIDTGAGQIVRNPYILPRQIAIPLRTQMRVAITGICE